MRPYIGTKLIEAEECPASKDYGTHRAGDPGYRVRYADGYESWSPKDVFEAAYLPMTVNRELKTDKPSISQEMVEDFISDFEVKTMGEKTTVVRAVLRNGFELVESSACVSVENYDEDLGAQICLKKIRDKIWFLLGFLLQTAVHGVSEAAEEPTDACPPETEATGESPWAPETEGKDWNPVLVDFGTAISEMKTGKKARRLGWNGKNQHIELATGISYRGLDGEIVNVEHEAIGNAAIAFHGTSGVQMGWLASQSDMLAEDWVILE